MTEKKKKPAKAKEIKSQVNKNVKAVETMKKPVQ